MTLLDAMPVVPEDFSETEDDILCFFCDDKLADPTRDTDACVDCATRHGDICSEDNCMADVQLLTEDGYKCERHTFLYLQDIVENAYQLTEQLVEEESKLHDRFIELQELKESDGNHSGEIQHQQHIFDQMKSNIQQRRSTLFSMRHEIEELQDKLDVELVSFSTYTEYEKKDD